jgi:hypothetical protein
MGRRSIPKQIIRSVAGMRESVLRMGRKWEKNLGAWSLAMAEDEVTDRVRECKEG